MRDGLRTVAALALQAAALLALVAAMLGTSWLDPRTRSRVLLLVDRSDSMPRGPTDEAVAEILQGLQRTDAPQVLKLEFAGKPGAAGADTTRASLQTESTDIESALQAALVQHARTPLAGVAVVSDGHSHSGDTERGLRALRSAGLALHWRAVGRPPPAASVADVRAPMQVAAGQPLEVSVRLQGTPSKSVSVTATARTASGDRRSAAAASDANGQATIVIDAPAGGPAVIDVAVTDSDSGAVLDTRADAAAVDIAPRAPLLYAHGSGAPLAQALQSGGWALDRVPAARLDSRADALDGYHAVVLDDVAVTDAGPRFWNALARAVRERGVGLLVLGGERSFAMGAYAGSVLESLLPVSVEPAALGPAAQVVFAIDKSGSMGAGSSGVDRFTLARRAVVETARGFGERDAVGVLVFDVAARVLLPLGPATSVQPLLERDWPVSPHGGTLLGPALDAAIAQLERAGAGRRLLVLVTDGFVDGAPLRGLQARLERAGIDLVALAVGPDADVGRLEQAVGPQVGMVLRVTEAADLPQAMRRGVEQRRARVQRGSIAVHQRAPLPFAPSSLAPWPPLAAHAATRPRPQAEVVLETAQGEPVLAAGYSGRGRVLALPGGLGAWAPQWLRWSQWARLAGGLAEAVGGAGARPWAHVVTVTEVEGALRFEADVDAGAAPPSTQAPAAQVVVDTPDGRKLPIAAEWAAPGRLRASAPDAGPGLYTFVLAAPSGTQRHLHLRTRRAEGRDWGIQPALQDWQRQGLLTPDARVWSAARQRATAAPGTPPDRALLALALGLFLLGVAVDRAGVERLQPGLARLLRRVRARTQAR